MKKLLFILLVVVDCVGALNVEIGHASSTYENQMETCCRYENQPFYYDRCSNEARIILSNAIDIAVDHFYVCNPSWQ